MTDIAGKTPDHVSPALYAIAASLNQEDPRSPGYKRTPVSTPFESPCGTPTNSRWHGRVIMRLGSASKFGPLDPRSPATRRTPLHAAATNEATVTPLTLSMGVVDPRSPQDARTPLPFSTVGSESVVATDDVVIATEEEMVCEEVALEEPEEKQELEEKQEESEMITEASAAAESTCERVITETFSSPEYTPSTNVLALAMSPLNSPLAARKRKDHTKVFAHSPLKKSYSAPVDENELPNPPSPVNKPLKQYTQARTPLSPLSQRKTKNSRHCTEVQPIKLRMDPTLLG